MNLADLIGILVIIVMTLWGAKKGLVKSVFSLGSLILSLILALTLYPIVTDFLDDSVVDDYVRLNVYKAFDAEETEPEQAREGLNLPESLQAVLTETVTEATGAVKESVAESVSGLAIKLLAIIIVFILVKVLLWVLVNLLGIITKLPVIRSLNKLLGGVMGAFYGVLILYLLLALLTFTTTLQTFNKPTQLVLESRYMSTMYHQNILLQFLK